MFSVSKAKNLTKKKEKLFLELSRITSKKEEECLDIPIQRATPLHVASAEGQVKVVEFLAQNGADIDAKNEFQFWLEPPVVSLPVNLLVTKAFQGYVLAGV
ncbi:unnamed protein product [Enterobius vermicularis]|uniref:ANK_REP_REGION domain-containing protein n=1 Tax=Enterobius vermicularis TaxID=51028 RepID=A0A0N4VB11_ENTVE|nr:unnamed protein product [Enterobius vermicularis]